MNPEEEIDAEKLRDEQRKNDAWTCGDWLLIAATMLSFAMAFALPLAFSWDCGHAQRTGSVMVLFSVILYHRQYLFLYPMARGSDMAFHRDGDGQMPKKRKKLQLFATGLLVVGTFMWGYGDLICRCLLTF